MDARTKLDIIYNDVLKDIRDVLDKIDQIKVDIPASIQQSVDVSIEKSNASFNNLTETLSEIEPAIQRAIAAETERAEIQVGILADAAERLNAAALDLGQKRLASVSDSIDTAVRTAVKGAVDSSLTGAVTENIADIKTELGKLFSSVNVDIINVKKELESIERKANRIAEEAEKTSQGSLYNRLLSMFGSGLVGALLALSLFVMAVNKDLINIKPIWDSRGVAVELYNHFKK